MAELKHVVSFDEDELEQSFFGSLLSSGNNAQSDGSGSNGERSQQYICDICGGCFPCRTYLNRHIKNVHGEGNAEHQKCPKCPMTFKKYDTFWEHVIRVHENPLSLGETGAEGGALVDKNLELCSADEEELASRGVSISQDEKEIEALVESWISEEDDTVCKKCGNRFCGKTNVKRHIREVHLKLPASKTNTGRVACQECNKTFVNNSIYNSHMRNIHLQPEPTIECPRCGRKFKEMKGVRRHLKDVHQVILDTSKTTAPQTAASSSNVDSHSKTVVTVQNRGDDKDNKGEEDQIFSCSKCKIQFVSLDGLNRHNKNVHLITTPRTPTPTLLKKELLECPECGKKFSSKNGLSGHIVVHQKASLEPYVKTMLRTVFGVICNSKLTCRLCGESVQNSIEGRLHVYIKHPEKFSELVTKEATSTKGFSQCMYCEQKLSLESMISHIESNHPDKYIPTCTQCGHKELKERDLNLHYKQFHPEVSRYNCDVCKRKFNQRRNLVHHIKSEHSVSSVQCPYCPEKHVKVKLHVTVKHPEKAEDYTQMRQAAIREEQVARKRFNQFLEKGTIPPERASCDRSSKEKQKRRKSDFFSGDNEQESEDQHIIDNSDNDVDYDEDSEIFDIKPNVCFVKETSKVIVPELYALQKDTATPHRIDVHRLPPRSPPPPDEIEIAEEEITDNNGKYNQTDNDEDVKPDVNKLEGCIIVNPTTVDTSNSPQQPLKKTLTLCLERLTDDQIAQWIPSSCHTPLLPPATPPSTSSSAYNDLPVKNVKINLSGKQVASHSSHTSRRGRKRRRR